MVSFPSRLTARALRVRLAAAGLFLLAASAGLMAGAQDTKSTGASGSDPAALALRDKMVKSYRDLHAFQEKVTQRQWKSKPEEASTIEIEMRYRKPNRLYLNIDYPQVEQPGRWHLTYACDGKTFTLYNSAKNEFQRIKAPENLTNIALPASLRGPEIEVLLHDVDPFLALDKSAIVKYASGFEEGPAGTADVLKLDIQQEGAKRLIQYRLDPKSNLLRSLTLKITPDSDQGSPFLEAEKPSSVEAVYTLEDTNPHFTDADFRFTPPADAKEHVPPHVEKVKQ